MSGEALKQEIRKSAEERAKTALAEAKSKAAAILADAEAEAKRILEGRVQDAARRLEQVERSEAAKARMECTKNILGLQSSYVERAFSEAESWVNGLPSRDPGLYRRVMTQFILDASRQLRSTSLVAVVRGADRAMMGDVIRKLGESSSKEEFHSSLSVSAEPLDAKGGVVLHTDDMRGYFVNTFESRFLQAREELRGRVSQTLLGIGEAN